MALWKKKFAITLDKTQPIMLNDATDGRAWMEHGVKKEQITGYLLRAIAGVAASNKFLITNYVCEINEKNDDKLQEELKETEARE